MRISINLTPADTDVIAEWLNTQAAGDCTIAQNNAVVRQFLTQAVLQTVIHNDYKSPATTQVFERSYSQFTRPGRRLPKSKRSGSPGLKSSGI
jgi:hypothetical protein